MSKGSRRIENGLSAIEGKAANIFKRLDEGVLPENLTKDEKIDLSVFLNALYFRTPFFVNAIMAGAKQLPASPEYQEWVNWLQIGAMTDENLPIQFYKMQMSVIENTSDIDFPLSDFPFVGARLRPSKDGKYEIVTELGSGTISLVDADVVIMVPIGPKKSLS